MQCTLLIRGFPIFDVRITQIKIATSVKKNNVYSNINNNSQGYNGYNKLCM